MFRERLLLLAASLVLLTACCSAGASAQIVSASSPPLPFAGERDVVSGQMEEAHSVFLRECQGHFPCLALPALLGGPSHLQDAWAGVLGWGYVSASAARFRVPYAGATCAPPGCTHVLWTGMEDWNGVLAQNGIDDHVYCAGNILESTCDRPARVQAWWEVYDRSCQAPEISVRFPVNPGDVLWVATYYEGGSRYRFVWKDLTTHTRLAINRTRFPRSIAPYRCAGHRLFAPSNRSTFPTNEGIVEDNGHRGGYGLMQFDDTSSLSTLHDYVSEYGAARHSSRWIPVSRMSPDLYEMGDVCRDLMAEADWADRARNVVVLKWDGFGLSPCLRLGFL